MGLSLEQNMVTLGQALSKHATPPGRMRIIEGINGSTVIDDSYNASPTAAEEALRTLGTLEIPGRTIFVMGDMLELGEYTAEAHEKIGVLAAEKADIVVGVGLRARKMVDAARGAGKPPESAFHVDTSVAGGEELKKLIHKGDVVLIKGSQSIRMERAVRAVMAHPDEAEKLLVRQEEEWLKKV